MKGIKILGIGKYAPEKIVTNDDFTKILDTSDEWITTRTGMKERRFSQGEPTWFMATKAAKQALEHAGISPSEIGIIITSSVTPDFSCPTMSCMVQREIGAIGSMTIDINCACAGFVYALDMAKQYLSGGDIKYALVIGAENLTKITDFEDRSTCILFGDGAAACVVEASDNFYTSFLGADGNGAGKIVSRLCEPQNIFMDENKKSYDDKLPETNQQFMYMDGKEVYKFATKILPEAVNKALAKTELTVEGIDIFIPHQANIRIIETAAKNLGVSLDKFMVNIQKYGNTSSASIPLALSEAFSEGKIKHGDKVCLVGFGAGLTYGALIFEY